MQGNTLKPAVGTGKPQTAEQSAASKRNFAGFQLKGMRSNLQFVRGQVPEAVLHMLESAINEGLACLSGTVAEPSEPNCTRIEEWSVTGSPGKYRLHGKVYGHRRLDIADADIISSSVIVMFDPARAVVLTRSGTEYKLGKPHLATAADRERGLIMMSQFHFTFPQPQTPGAPNGTPT